MKKALVICACVFFSPPAFATEVPTGIGDIRLGMSQAEYLSVVRIKKPFDCNKFAKHESSRRMYFSGTSGNPYWDGKIPDKRKSLCENSMAQGTTERMQVGEVSYDVVSVNSSLNQVIEKISVIYAYAFFMDDKLVGIWVNYPKVSVDQLKDRYGEPEVVENTSIEHCRNNMGVEFENVIGEVVSTWSNGEVGAIYRAGRTPNRKTCTDGANWTDYSVVQFKEFGLIEAAIKSHNDQIDEERKKANPF